MSQGSLPGYQAVRCNLARRPDQTGDGERAGHPFAAERVDEPLVGFYPHQSPASALFVSWLDELLFLCDMDDLLLTYLEITSLPETSSGMLLWTRVAGEVSDASVLTEQIFPCVFFKS